MLQYERFCNVVHDSHMRNAECLSAHYTSSHNGPALQSLSLLDSSAGVAQSSCQILGTTSMHKDIVHQALCSPLM